MSQSSSQQNASLTPSPSAYHYRGAEISLIDLAKILVRRRKLMAAVFSAVVVLALLIAFLLPKKYTYTTIYTPARVNATTELASPSGLLSKMNSLYVPEQTRVMLKKSGSERSPFKISVSNPKNTNLIILSSDATEKQADQVVALQMSAIDKLKGEQNAEVNRQKELLNVQIRSNKKQLEIFNGKDVESNRELAASLMAIISQLEYEVNSYQNGYVSAETTKSIDPKGPGKSVIVLLGIVLGSILAVMAAFACEFSSKVCRSLAEE